MHLWMLDDITQELILVLVIPHFSQISLQHTHIGLTVWDLKSLLQCC